MPYARIWAISSLAALNVLTIISPSGGARAADVPDGQCLDVVLLDSKNNFIAVEPPPIGIMIDGTPMLATKVPPHAKRVPGSPVACPPEVLEQVRSIYGNYCGSEENIVKTMKQRKTNREKIEKRCAQMKDVLAGN